MNPKNFFAELKRRNVYKVAIAYAVAGGLVVQIAFTVLPTFHAAEWVLQIFVLLVALGWPVALVLAWAFEITPQGIVRTEEVASHASIAHRTGRKLTALIVIVAVAAAALLFQRTKKRSGLPASPAEEVATRTQAIAEKSIAVLPFVNMSSDQENAYFVDGLTEEILSRVAQVRDLKVPGRTSSFVFKNQNRDLREVGAALGVANVLEGSVRKSDDRLRITAQLVRTSDGYQLWSQAFDRKLDDIFAIQEEIARAIADALSVQLKLVGNKADRPTQDMAAYGEYLEARALITQRNADNLRRATTPLEAAVQWDPGFAKVWAALAQARALGFYYLVAPMKQSLEGAESAARSGQSIRRGSGRRHSNRCAMSRAFSICSEQ